MRDILITVVILGSLPFILRSPRVGVYVWAWLAMMIPHRAAFGFARALPFGQIVAIATLVSFLLSRERRPFPISSTTVVYIALVLWMSFTSFFAINTAEVVFERWLFVFKIHVMLFITMMLIRGRQQIEWLVWLVVVSIGVYGIKGGVWTLMTGGGGRVFGPPGGFAQENNAFGLALVILMPFFYYLYQVSTRRIVRLGLLSSMVAVIFSILGSQSRGALLALFAMATLLGLKGKRPILSTLLLAGGVAAAILFMPDSWSGRMKTIETYQEDTSAMSRIYTWKTLWALAVDRPLVGGGFVIDTPQVFAIYAPAEGVGVYTGGQVFVAHSIYFQMLGEHGFPGLALYLLLGISAWRQARRVGRQAQTLPEYANWAPLLMRMVQVSLAGFAVGGAFLSLAHFDLSYYIISFAVLVDATLREQQKAGAAAGAVLPASAGSISPTPK
ncbi:MAG TPA: putative O-glycosylation ligase, exosortase A system-associated [Accumulibacter sp.]|uniref:putative O-glycosylation ligase, exosortase A system-associated n=1 Tax=Accumulibacter sp. TaxID=2053492 RepID=UPI0025CBF599|nr:putative O-glycosylation ligase, exosortase A system-associated [Accumulibacter sp.]MCM8600487.1 putative O-glycosylation ligase, exosortase A system-associated [Accumulibacter sp.]MCM8662535.1 putative O-glycosylation ligase, exosortase A system-associated [Accumulibacter sp.]HNC51671.1 putative O-glycosylation ligase, exosortase A system-associated [Accumulibacter sp.]